MHRLIIRLCYCCYSTITMTMTCCREDDQWSHQTRTEGGKLCHLFSVFLQSTDAYQNDL